MKNLKIVALLFIMIFICAILFGCNKSYSEPNNNSRSDYDSQIGNNGGNNGESVEFAWERIPLLKEEISDNMRGLLAEVVQIIDDYLDNRLTEDEAHSKLENYIEKVEEEIAKEDEELEKTLAGLELDSIDMVLVSSKKASKSVTMTIILSEIGLARTDITLIQVDSKEPDKVSEHKSKILEYRNKIAEKIGVGKR